MKLTASQIILPSLATALILCGGICALPVSCMVKLDLDESLWGAAQHGDITSMKRLLKLGANPDFRFDGGEPVLVASVLSASWPATKLLLEHGADPKVLSEVNRSALPRIFEADPRFRPLLRPYHVVE